MSTDGRSFFFIIYSLYAGGCSDFSHHKNALNGGGLYLKRTCSNENGIMIVLLYSYDLRKGTGRRQRCVCECERKSGV